MRALWTALEMPRTQALSTANLFTRIGSDAAAFKAGPGPVRVRRSACSGASADPGGPGRAKALDFSTVVTADGGRAGEWSLPAVHDVLAAAIPDRDMLVCGDVRRTFAEVAGAHPVDRGLARRPRAGRAPRARPARAVGEGPGHRRPRPPQLHRVRRGDARRLPGPGGAVQRQPALPAGRDRRRPRRPRGAGGRLPPPVRPARRRRVRPDRAGPRRRRRRLRRRAAAGQHELRGRRGARPSTAAADAVARRPLPGVHRRHDRPAQGGAVAAGRHLRLGDGRHRGRDRGIDRGRRDRERRRRLVRGAAAHARGRAVDRVRGSARRRDRPGPRRRRPVRRRPRPRADRARACRHDVDRRRRLRPPARGGARPPDATTSTRCG